MTAIRNSRPEGRKIEHVQPAFKRSAPVLAQALAFGTCQHFSLEPDKIRIARSALGKDVCDSRLRRPIEQPEFIQQHPQRPAVNGYVMRGYQKDVFRLVTRKQVRAEHRSAFQIEWKASCVEQPFVQTVDA